MGCCCGGLPDPIRMPLSLENQSEVVKVINYNLVFLNLVGTVICFNFDNFFLIFDQHSVERKKGVESY